MLHGSSSLGFAYMDGGYPFGWVFDPTSAAVVLGEDSPLRAALVVKRLVVAVIGDGYAPGARLQS